MTIANPAAGPWVVLVDPYAIPAGKTSYQYLDVFANPAFGSLSVTDANALRPSASSWIVPGSLTANAAPAPDACCAAPSTSSPAAFWSAPARCS